MVLAASGRGRNQGSDWAVGKRNERAADRSQRQGLDPGLKRKAPVQ